MNKDLLGDKFDYIFIFSPYKLPELDLELNVNWFNEFDILNLFEIIKLINNPKK